MKKLAVLVLLTAVIGLSGFKSQSLENHEQIALEYFLSDIITEDFKDISSIQFDGKTEETFSSLKGYKFCLTPERLGSLIGNGPEGKMPQKQVNFVKPAKITISSFTKDNTTAKLLVYHSLHVADNYYVFLSLQVPKQSDAVYIFEVTPDGKISRSCKAS